MLVRYAKGFVIYWYALEATEKKRLEYARGEFLRGSILEADENDPHAVRAVALCKKAVEEIDTWIDTSIRLDDKFNRPFGKAVGGGWLESDKAYGINILAVNTDELGGHVRFEGTQGIFDMGLTFMERQIPAANFASFQMTVRPESMPKAELGMSLYFANLGSKGEDRWMGFHLGRDMKGKLRFKTGMERDLDRKDMAGWIEIKKPLPSESELTLRLVRTEKKRVPLLSVWVMDPETGEWSELQKDIQIPVAKNW